MQNPIIPKEVIVMSVEASASMGILITILASVLAGLCCIALPVVIILIIVMSNKKKKAQQEAAQPAPEQQPEE